MSLSLLLAEQCVQPIYLSLLALYLRHEAHLFGLHQLYLRQLITDYVVLLDYLILIENFLVTQTQYLLCERLILELKHVVLRYELYVLVLKAVHFVF